LVLVLSVLLQPGKADAGALFTSSVSSTAFGPRGTQTILAKITIVAAITFMLTAMAISLNVGGTRSVLQTTDEPPVSQQPQATPATTPSTDPAPAQTGDGAGGATTAPASDANAANTNAANTNAANTNAANASNANAATAPATASPQASPAR
jgi:preprotein translocase subunit SecG